MAIYKNNTEVKDIYMVGHGLPDPNAVGLVEDVDYVRYEWLKGDGAAYINTLIHDLSNVQILSIKSKLPTSEQTLFGRERKGSSFLTQLIIYSQIDRYSVWVNNGGAALYCRKEDTVTFDFDNNIVKSSTNQISKMLGKVDGWNIYLFGRCLNNRLYVSAGKVTVGNFKIDSLIDLIPCRLLHSIPASLDANNRARQEGEYGMIDLVSKKFYGNVNNSGSFTGEGLIQKKVTFAFFNGKHVFGEMQEGVHIRRYGWLKGDGAAYVYLGDVLDYIEFDTKIPSTNRNFGFVYGINGALRSVYNKFRAVANDNVIKNYDLPFYGRIKVDLSAHLVYANGEAFAYTNKIQSGTNAESAFRSAYLYGDISGFNVFHSNQSLSNINKDGNFFTPCKLLRAIPAELDANGIARAAGVCGMYDEKNHKFYGNIANSGTFTVEGMAEGYDYEVYQYLIGDGSAYATTTVNIYRDTVNTLIVPTTNVVATTMIDCHERIGDTNDFVELRTFIGFGNEFTSRHTVRVNDVADPNKIRVADNYVNETYTIKTTRSGTNYVYYLNGSHVATSDHGQYEEADINVTPKIYANGCKLGYFSTSGSNNVNLRPCKLLRAIPAELDANGIARSANECGMVDTYTGLFYGNVNNDGAFTVEGEGLVEGYHYEKYDWIERKSRNTGNMFSLTLSNTADTIVRIWNYKTQGTNGRDMIYLNNTDKSKYFIYPDFNAEGKTLMRHSDSSSPTVIATEQDVELTLRSGKVNGITTRAYNSISICPSTVSGNLTKVGRIYSDSYDYVPCKLLRNIPANRTVDGNSYPAGTAGMVEKFSGKFQPIASALSLTLSNDE